MDIIDPSAARLPTGNSRWDLFQSRMKNAQSAEYDGRCSIIFLIECAA